MIGILLVGALLVSANGLPFRLQEDLFMRDLLRREIKGCKSDKAEVVFAFDTSGDVDDGQFDEDKAFAAKASRFLSKDIKILAEVYGSGATDKGTIPFANAQTDLNKVEGKVGGQRDAAAALEEAGKLMTGSGKKIVVLFVDGDIPNKDAVKSAASSLNDAIIYVSIPKKKYHDLKGQVADLAAEGRLIATTDMVLAEDFQLDLHVEYGEC